MKKAKYISVLTGDIVGSTEIRNSRYKDKLLLMMKSCFKEIKQNEKRGIVQQPFEIFRGDSFQGIVTDISRALIITLKLKALLQMQAALLKKSQLQVRISIGIGKPGVLSKSVNESDGEAFKLSGKQLDRMKEQSVGISITCTDETFNSHYEILCTLLDLVISRWTIQQAEVIYHWLNDKTQNEIADILKLAQPSVNQRAQLGNRKEIEKALDYYNWLTQQL